ncbi:unnamed protein product [Caenorhabditis brenneri]
MLKKCNFSRKPLLIALVLTFRIIDLCIRISCLSEWFVVDDSHNDLALNGCRGTLRCFRDGSFTLSIDEEHSLLRFFHHERRHLE